MAALSEQSFLQLPGSLVDLRNVKPNHLDPLLAEEAEEWRSSLDWDFRASGDLVRRFVAMRALTGVALRGNSLPSDSPYCAYAYYVADEGKGLVGGLYVSRRYRTPEIEQALLTSVLESLWHTSGVRRVEAQLMTLSEPMSRNVPFPEHFTVHPRKFLEAPLTQTAQLPAKTLPLATAAWSSHYHGEAARLIASAYTNHIDSQINDQYRTAGGARRFLANIVQYPGCGTFFAPASLLAFGRPGGAEPPTEPASYDPAVGLAPRRRLRLEPANPPLAGLCLTSLVSERVGHITQVCVAPSERGTGLGYELLRRSMVALAAHGCHSVTLTVTSANSSALQLYERMGFSCRREFAAYVWEKP